MLPKTFTMGQFLLFYIHSLLHCYDRVVLRCWKERFLRVLLLDDIFLRLDLVDILFLKGRIRILVDSDYVEKGVVFF